MKSFTLWLASTPLSTLIQEKLWIIPAVQSIHILALTVVLGSVFMLELRVFDLAGRSQTIMDIERRFLPWLWGALLVMAVSGVLLLIGEPDRSLRNPAFWIKMGLLAVAVALTVIFANSVRRNGYTAEKLARQSSVRLLAALTVFVWCAIAVAGRWIAYVDVY
jgi:uncharacterized membrane protein